MHRAYCRLHDLGHAHSIEIWHQGELVGGLYGVAVGRVFYGESMFSLMSDASKVALALLAVQLRRWNFALIDCQVRTEHLARMGLSKSPRRLSGPAATLLPAPEPNRSLAARYRPPHRAVARPPS